MRTIWIVGMLAVAFMAQAAEAQWPRFRTGPDPRGNGTDDYIPPDPTQLVFLITNIDRPAADQVTRDEMARLKMQLGSAATPEDQERIQKQIDRVLGRSECTVEGEAAILTEARGRWQDRRPNPLYLPGGQLIIAAGKGSKSGRLKPGDFILVPNVPGFEDDFKQEPHWRADAFNVIEKPRWWPAEFPQPANGTSSSGSAPPSKSAPTPVNTGPSVSGGSGFFITTDGYFVTNEHVVSEGKIIKINVGDKTHHATVVRSDAANDLALLKVTGQFPALHIAGCTSVRLADKVATIGFPLTGVQGTSAKYTEGSISSLSGVEDDHRYFQISVPVQPGNSGGPLFDSQGKVVGVIRSKLNFRSTLNEYDSLPENVNYAVKSSLLTAMIESVPDLQKKCVAPPLTGNPPNPADVADMVQKACARVIVERW